MKYIAVTGADGIVGSAIRPALADFVVTAVDSSVVDNDCQLMQVFDGHDAVIHLAWSKVMGPSEPEAGYVEVLPTDNRHLKNLEMAATVIRAAQESGVRRLILASS